MKRVCCLAMVEILINVATLQAANYYVAQNGQTPSSHVSWTTAASNIQDAVNSATHGDTVWVGPGRYTAPSNPTNYESAYNVVYIPKNIDLRSSSGNPQNTIIDGEGSYRGIAFACNYTSPTAKPFLIDGFTISNCWATGFGGGVLLVYGGTTLMTSVVQNCIISDNKLTWKSGGGYGGGFFARHGHNYMLFSPVLSNCVVRGNEALYGPAAGNFSFGGGVGNLHSTLMLMDCTVEDNVATIGGGSTAPTGCWSGV